MEDLRRLTVKVLLGLLVFQIVGNYVDDILLGNRYQPAVEIYALLAGMMTGLFTPEILRRNGTTKLEGSLELKSPTESQELIVPKK